ncbi:MAG: hypothetical protein PHQ62_00720 [Clostridia bacterium]|nr:hypothetical protein [Clostridia bacterium]
MPKENFTIYKILGAIDNDIAYFDLFFRKVPDNGSFVIANGVKKCLQYLEQFKFSKSDIEYLKSLKKLSNEYIEKLKNIKFTGDVWAVEDGTVVFPNEPVITIKAPLLEAQLVETSLLLFQIIFHTKLVQSNFLSDKIILRQIVILFFPKTIYN